jgi:hypothetical protein
MKRSKINIVVALFLGTLIFIGCQEKKDYPPLVLGDSDAPTVTLINVTDSINENYTYLQLSSNMDGSIYYLALPQGSEAPTADAIILGQTDPAAITITAVKDEQYTIKLKGLASGGSYDLYAVSTNAEEGKAGTVAGPVSFTCLDLTAPFVVEMVPANGETWVSNTLQEIVLTMNESVTLADAAKVHVVDAFDESDLGVMGDITVDGSTVSIAITDTLPYLTDVVVILDKGAFTDAVDSLSAEVYTDGGSFALMFSVQGPINMENFIGAYHCHDIDYAYADEYDYDVMLFQSGDFTVDIYNFANFDIGLVATLEFDPVTHTCGLPDQFSGLSAGGSPLNFTSEELATDVVAFTPGSYTDDGITIKFSMWLYDPAVPENIYWVDDMELTKYITPGLAPVLNSSLNRTHRDLLPLKKF